MSKATPATKVDTIVTLSLTGGTTTFDFGGGEVPAIVNVTLTTQ